MCEEKGRDKDENSPTPAMYVFKADDPQRLSNKLGLHMQQENGEKQATKNIQITIKPGKIRDSEEDIEYISPFSFCGRNPVMRPFNSVKCLQQI